MSPHTFFRRMFVACALVFAFSTPTLIPGPQLMAQDTAPDSIQGVYTGVFHPGRPTSVSIQLRVDQDRDVLIDFLDKTGWYTGIRRTVKAGTSYVSAQLPLPDALRDLSSAYVSVKIIPVGGEWFQKIAEVNQPVRFVTLEPIRAALYYNYPLSTFSAPVGRGISNHDGVSVFVRQQNGRYEMGYLQSGYGQEQELILDLLSGDLNFRMKNSMGITDISTITAASIADDSQSKHVYVQHLQRMKGYFEHVESGRMADLSGDYPILREANSYLRQVLFTLEPLIYEKLETPVLQNPNGGPTMPPRPGKELAVKVHYEAGADRDLLLTVKAQGRVLSSQRFKAAAGEDTLVLPLVLPKDAPTVETEFSLALVPQSAGLEATLAQARIQANVLPLNSIDYVYVSEQVSSLTDLYMSVTYASVEPLDLRVDLYDASGQRLDRIQTPLEVTEVGSIYTMKFSQDYELASGRTYTLVFRLVPAGSTSENGFGDIVKFFRKRDVN
ncbi:MAG TPA: hypothetical protein VFO10_06450 [Oligoflexus sp.]|uniref:hypothetical protein n=1 Tax=Oligoflexus sp. TaxID=1971216 RepID=UPI002D80B826|nr:hypothetical protein [Oligoflexus sp.]HET9236871.1 hypothetical protein [Oligoflexus sp.]